MENALNNDTQKTKMSASEILKEAFAQVQPNGRSTLPKALAISGSVFPAGSTVFFCPDSNAVLKTESNRRPSRHWNQAIIFLGDQDASCVRIFRGRSSTSDDGPTEESFTAKLMLRGRARMDAEMAKSSMPAHGRSFREERGRLFRPARGR